MDDTENHPGGTQNVTHTVAPEVQPTAEQQPAAAEQSVPRPTEYWNQCSECRQWIAIPDGEDRIPCPKLLPPHGEKCQGEVVCLHFCFDLEVHSSHYSPRPRTQAPCILMLCSQKYSMSFSSLSITICVKCMVHTVHYLFMWL